MREGKPDFRNFLREYSDKSERKRTLNVDESIHSFYKNVAAHYDISISTIVNNVLFQWKSQHSDEIKKDILRRLNDVDL